MSIFPTLSDYEAAAPSLDDQIEATQRLAEQLQATIAKLHAEGHEVADATKQLAGLLQSLEVMLRARADRDKGSKV